MTPQRITLITLGVADMARSRAFYAALGWQMHSQSQDGDLLPGQRFRLRPVRAGRPGERPGQAGRSAWHRGGDPGPNFETEAEVDAAYARALAAGASALKAPEKVFWGGYSGYFADPDGHVWELAMNPFWPLAADGSLTLPDAD